MGLRLLSFAHLGIGAKAPKAKADKDKKKGAQAQAGADASSEEDDGEGGGEDESEEEAQEDSEEENAETDENEEEGEGEEDKDEQAKAVNAARLGERARCAAIFAAPEAAGKVEVAAELAFNSELSAKQAIAVMKAIPAGSSAGRLAKAMESVTNPSLGADGGAGTTSGGGAGASAEERAANRILASARSARGERKRA
jgi:hypothetical protein